MDIKQIYSIINDVTKEVLGESVVLAEDLSNIVDVGTAIFDNASFDKYCKSLVDHIGRVVFVDRKYNGRVPSIVMTGWEYGAVLEKLACELPEAQENESWALQDNTSYDQQVFKAPQITAHFYNKRVTFEIQMSFVEKQFKSAFSNATQAASFVSMIMNAIENSFRIKLDALIARAINNMVLETVYDDYQGGSISATSGIKAVNVLKLYNDRFNEALTAAEACTDKEFIRFASNLITLYKGRLASESVMFNVDGKARFTPADKLHLVVIDEFAAGATAYLQSDTYNKEMVALPSYETVPYWQGSGTGYDFADTSKIMGTSASGHQATVTGVLAVMFDSDAVAVANMDRRTTTAYNAKGEFTNNFYKMDAAYLNSLQENFVVFFAA